MTEFGKPLAASQDEAGHALNNLLAKILGCAELALASTPDAHVRAELELIANLAESAAPLVNALATRARSSDGGAS